MNVRLPAPRTPEPWAGATEPPEPSEPTRSRQARTRQLLRHPVTIATAAAAVTHILWFFLFANSGGDLAAQDAWAEFVGRYPGTAYNLAWYGGMHPVSPAWSRRI